MVCWLCAARAAASPRAEAWVVCGGPALHCRIHPCRIHPRGRALAASCYPQKPRAGAGQDFCNQAERVRVGFVVFIYLFFFFMEKMLMCQNKVSLRECASFSLTLFRNFWSKLRSRRESSHPVLSHPVLCCPFPSLLPRAHQLQPHRGTQAGAHPAPPQPCCPGTGWGQAKGFCLQMWF